MGYCQGTTHVNNLKFEDDANQAISCDKSSNINFCSKDKIHSKTQDNFNHNISIHPIKNKIKYLNKELKCIDRISQKQGFNLPDIDDNGIIPISNIKYNTKLYLRRTIKRNNMDFWQQSWIGGNNGR
ncbi:unnamed protein product [Blumeria hordei]|uniref:Uncharacterized protein n=1 Tax=Blumeria hordei TaxID=2867405 RepID=A0A383UJB6_BLUHO|nr:unnamed protein product [Blumeria hordei]